MVSMLAVAMPCVSTMSGVPTVCFMTSMVLTFVPVTFVPMTLRIVPVLAAVTAGVAVLIVVSTVLVVPSMLIVHFMVGRLMRSCWGLSHSCFLLRAGGAGSRGRCAPEEVISWDTPNGRMTR